MKTLWQVFLGTALGLCLFFTVLLVFHKPIVERYFLDITLEKIQNEQYVLLLNKIKKDSISLISTPTTNYDERLISMNKRFDDFYIMAGIIITLLLAINIGIYVNTDSKVDRYFQDHFEEQEAKIKKKVAESEKIVATLKSTTELYMEKINTKSPEQETK